MSNESEDAVVPAVPPAESAPLPPADPQENAPDNSENSGEGASWLKPRLDQAERSGATKILKGLGVDNADTLKEKLARLDQLETEQLSEKERTEKALSDATAKAGKAGEYEKIITNRRDREFKGLSESQQAAVLELAGDDAAAQLRTIDALQDSWKPRTENQGADDKGKGKEKATSKDTAPPRDAPPDNGGSTSPPDHRAHYKELKKTNPVAAGVYLSTHEAEIYPRA